MLNNLETKELSQNIKQVLEKLNNKQKAKLLNKATLSEKRKEKKEVKKANIQLQNSLAPTVVREKKEKKKGFVSLEQIKLRFYNNPYISLGEERLKEEWKKANFPISKRYEPSQAAKKHHKIVEEHVKTVQKQREGYSINQQVKKVERKNRAYNSPYRLVCIKKDQTLMRISRGTAKEYVDTKGWEYIPKSVWKAERANPNSTFTLVWQESRINLEKAARKIMSSSKVTSRFMRDKRKKLRQQEDAEIKTIKIRRLRKRRGKVIDKRKDKIQKYYLSNFAIRNQRVIVKEVAFNPMLLDLLERKYYTCSKEAYKVLQKKFNTPKGILNAIIKKDTYADSRVIEGDMSHPHFRNEILPQLRLNFKI